MKQNQKRKVETIKTINKRNEIFVGDGGHKVGKFDKAYEQLNKQDAKTICRCAHMICTTNTETDGVQTSVTVSRILSKIDNKRRNICM